VEEISAFPWAEGDQDATDAARERWVCKTSGEDSGNAPAATWTLQCRRGPVWQSHFVQR